MTALAPKVAAEIPDYAALIGATVWVCELGRLCDGD